jgi:predicted nicotinamide N-methyase
VVQFTQLFVYRFWMPAGELQARLLSAFNTMMARAPLVEASGEGLSAAAAANQTAPAVAATDIIGGQP